MSVWAVFACLCCGVVSAAPGDLDPTFGMGGKLSLALPSFTLTSATAAAIQPDGKIVVAGQCMTNASPFAVFCVTRLHSNGTVDSSFSDGKTHGYTVSSVDSIDAQANAAVIDPLGRIVVGGRCSNGGGYGKFCLVRFTSAGMLDLTFNAPVSPGLAILEIGAGDAALHSLINAENGATVAVGACMNSAYVFQTCLAKFKADGTLDATFGGGGTYIGTDARGATLAAAATQSDGRIVAAGSCMSDTGYSQLCVTRFSANGAMERCRFGVGWCFFHILGLQIRDVHL